MRNNLTTAAHAELITTADDLGQRMDADLQGGIVTDNNYGSCFRAYEKFC